MISPLWTRRAAALLIVVCSALVIGGFGKVYAAWVDVRVADENLAALQTSPSQDQAWMVPKPILRADAPTTEARLHETLRRSMDLRGEPVITIGPVRPLGDGLRLVEATITLPGDALTLETISQWGAINRDSARVSDLSLMLGPDGKSRVMAKLIVVIA